jgi:agmatine deiminase
MTHEDLPMSTPRALGHRMPPEWAPHARTWMELPPANETFGAEGSDELDRYRRAWAAVTNAIARFEPVSLVCRPGDEAAARALVAPGVTIHTMATDEAWFRDSGPTFLLGPAGELGAVHWTFNGWGAQDFCVWGDESRVGSTVAELAGARLFRSTMVNEGGGIHVDGEGTALVTETVQLDPDRNPGWDHARVEAELMDHLGVERVLWLPRGLTKDYERFGTRGHIDMVACWVRPGLVVAHEQPDPSHPDHEVCRDNIARLRASTDAAGRQLEVVPLVAPGGPSPDEELVDWSYVNHYVCNGAVILCAFDDPGDQEAADVLGTLYPGREIVLVDARPIFECGGGIHCITQQQPLAAG